MIANLKVAFKSLVDDAPWMDEVTKVVAREKADYMRQLVAYPDWVKNASAVTAYYNGVSAPAAPPRSTRCNPSPSQSRVH